MTDSEHQTPEAPKAPEAQPAATAPPPTPPSTDPRIVAPQRTPFLAGVLSAVLPGFGNVYNGLFTRGLLNFLIFVSIFFTAIQSNGGPELALLLPAMLFTWLFGIVDAYRNSMLINLGATEMELQDNLPDMKAGGGLAVGVALFLIGLYGFLTQALDFDLTIIFDYWYLILMGFGGWLIFHGLQSRKKSTTEAGWSEDS